MNVPYYILGGSSNNTHNPFHVELKEKKTIKYMYFSIVAEI